MPLHQPVRLFLACPLKDLRDSGTGEGQQGAGQQRDIRGPGEGQQGAGQERDSTGTVKMSTQTEKQGERDSMMQDRRGTGGSRGRQHSDKGTVGQQGDRKGPEGQPVLDCKGIEGNNTGPAGI